MTSDWRVSLAGAIRSPRELLKRLDLPDLLLPSAEKASAGFPLLVPESYLRRMRPGDPADPLLLQVLPVGQELDESPGFVKDAVDDQHAHAAPGLLRKYVGRVLMILTGTCAIHCRYCFRRHYPYDEEPRKLEDWAPAFKVIADDESIHEVLLSGGDPLLMSDRRLGELIERLESIPHVRRLRIHSRLPIVLPDRVTEELVQRLTTSRLIPIMVVHANHPQEIVDDCSEMLRKLVRSGITTLNQSVLLRGINDSVEALRELSERLIDLGVIPYYLHQLDRVQGAAHFEVDETRGRELVAELRNHLPGYAIPRFVREVAGAAHKLPLD